MTIEEIEEKAKELEPLFEDRLVLWRGYENGRMDMSFTINAKEACEQIVEGYMRKCDYIIDYNILTEGELNEADTFWGVESTSRDGQTYRLELEYI
jgi:hypothetical protein